MNTLFDGSYKRKPLVALGGRVKTVGSVELLSRLFFDVCLLRSSFRRTFHSSAHLT